MVRGPVVQHGEKGNHGRGKDEHQGIRQAGAERTPVTITLGRVPMAGAELADPAIVPQGHDGKWHTENGDQAEDAQPEAF